MKLRRIDFRDFPFDGGTVTGYAIFDAFGFMTQCAVRTYTMLHDYATKQPGRIDYVWACYDTGRDQSLMNLRLMNIAQLVLTACDNGDTHCIST